MNAFCFAPRFALRKSLRQRGTGWATRRMLIKVPRWEPSFVPMSPWVGNPVLGFIMLLVGETGHQDMSLQRSCSTCFSHFVCACALLFWPLLGLGQASANFIGSENCKVPYSGADSTFTDGSNDPSDASEESSKDGGENTKFKLTSDKSTYNRGEWFPLRVSLTEQDAELQAEPASCPILCLRQRSPDGWTRIDEIQPLAVKGCKHFSLGRTAGDWQSGFEIDSGANSRWGGLGEHAFQVFQVARAADDKEVHITSSNVLRVQIADPEKMPRKWGPHVKGIAADVTLDKDTFRVGEEVPLHIAIENFDAEGSVYGGDPTWDPCLVIGLKVLDARGQVLTPNDRLPPRSYCMGHGRSPMLYAKGKLIPLERSLGAQGWLPNHPGTFIIVVTWMPLITADDEPPNDYGRSNSNSSAMAQAVATIRVTGNESSPTP